MVASSHWLVKKCHKQGIFILLFLRFLGLILFLGDLATEGGYLCCLLFEPWIILYKGWVTLVFLDCAYLLS